MSDQAVPSIGCTGACPSPPHLQLYQTIIFATPVLFAFSLLLVFCLLYFRRRSRAASIHSRIRAQLFAEGLLATPPIEQGLSTSFRQRLPITIFDDKFSSTCQDTQCPVCLGDYQLNEKLQQLPLCKHSFHLQCIDEWLAKNATCPVCRASFDDVENGGFMGQFQCVEVHATMQTTPRTADAVRMWEERVISGAQNHALPSRSNAHNVESSRDTSSPEHEVRRIEGVHTINIERS